MPKIGKAVRAMFGSAVARIACESGAVAGVAAVAESDPDTALASGLWYAVAMVVFKAIVQIVKLVRAKRTQKEEK